MEQRKTRENYITLKKPKEIQNKFEKPTVFYSFAWSRFVAGLILLGFGLADYFLLGHLIGHQNEENIGVYVGQGSAVFLGGISFFYTVGLVPLLIGLWLILFAILSIYKCEISKSVSESSFYYHEKRLIFPFYTEFKKIDITKSRIRNNHLGSKKLWYFLLIPMSITILNFGFALFGEHRAVDEILPTMMILTAFGNFIALGLLVVFPQSFVEFSSSDKIYGSWIAPLLSKEKFTNSIIDLLDFPQKESDVVNKPDIDRYNALLLEKNGEIPIESSNIALKSQKNYLRLVLGITLILTAVISLSFEILFSKSFSGLAATYGILIVVQGYNLDFANSISLNFDSKTKRLKFKKQFGKKIHAEILDQVEDVRVIESFRKFEIIDVILTVVLVYLSTFEAILGWKYVDFSNPLIVFDNILKILFCMLIFLIFIYYWAIPNPHLCISGKEVKSSYLEIPGSHSLKHMLKKIIKKIKKTTRSPPNKKNFILRTCILLGIHVIALIIALLI
ncbi:hypothetical protein DSAG12_03795 [Promethearchaeum syntrophicum]|uniref:Uncharacterized protein n=1 Tax=Promethearchaeum syntrophicum TaxID=2594042 RepID=A0A5B9DH17_9ARCH|nr:hypothetical protein [Candidatus Prometheoarchaeum syntrophicum]QEE17957.1 hypothetical protein DSAG12_03795 [Candidatus Prometheoarchaeum syntrophicum]